MKKQVILLFILFGLTHLNQIIAQTKKVNSTKSNTIKATAKKKKESAPITDDSETYNGHKVYTGPRGGKYYVNSNGNKTYIKH